MKQHIRIRVINRTQAGGRKAITMLKSEEHEQRIQELIKYYRQPHIWAKLHEENQQRIEGNWSWKQRQQRLRDA